MAFGFWTFGLLFSGFPFTQQGKMLSLPAPVSLCVANWAWPRPVCWRSQCFSVIIKLFLAVGRAVLYRVEQVENKADKACTSFLCFARRSRCQTTSLVQDLSEVTSLHSSSSPGEPGAKCYLVRSGSVPGLSTGTSRSQSCRR